MLLPGKTVSNTDCKVVIGLLAHKDIKQFQHFIRNHWRKDHLFAQEASVFNWQHKGDAAYHCMVAKRENELLGVQCLIPQSHFDASLPRNQIFLALWRALEDKEIGIGLRLFKAIVEEYKPEFIGSIGIASIAIPFHVWQGFTVGRMDHHVFLSPYVSKFTNATVPFSVRKKFLSTESLFFEKISEVSSFKNEIDSLGLYQLPIKSSEFIRNRYMRHPVYSYEVLGIFQGSKLYGLCVFRLIKHNEAIILRWVDFMGPNEIIAALQVPMLNIMKKYNAEYIDIYSHGIPSELLQEAGFVDRYRMDNLVVPNYFEPFEKKNVDLYFAYKACTKNTLVRLFKSDGDQDRPNKVKDI